MFGFAKDVVVQWLRLCTLGLRNLALSNHLRTCSRHFTTIISSRQLSRNSSGTRLSTPSLQVDPCVSLRRVGIFPLSSVREPDGGSQLLVHCSLMIRHKTVWLQ